MAPKIIAPFALVLLLLTLFGCTQNEQQIAPVTGRVTLDAQPLAHAEVTFQPDGDKRSSSAQTDDNGQYQLSYKRGEMGAIVGPHTVRISVSAEVVQNPPNIPPRYNTQSELKATVKPGNNSCNFDLNSAPSAP